MQNVENESQEDAIKKYLTLKTNGNHYPVSENAEPPPYIQEPMHGDYETSAIIMAAYERESQSMSIDDEIEMAALEVKKVEKSLTTSQKKEKEIWQKASILGCCGAKIIASERIDYLNILEKRWWFEPRSISDSSSYVPNFNLIHTCKNPVVDMARALADNIQFPVNTAYLHGLGVIASLTVRNFKIAYWDSNELIPCNLYVVTSQPPSSGKSGINNGFTKHARILIAEKNEKNRARRTLLKSKLDKEMKAAEKLTQNYEIEQALKSIERISEELSLIAEYNYGLNDVTPEAAEDLASKQGGVVTIVSAESFGVKTILGELYANGAPNNNFFLSGWDGEHVGSARITRPGFSGFAFVSIAVLAQDPTFDSILASAGKDSGGISERFLLGREPRMAGNRKSKDRKPIEYEVKRRYNKLVENILSQSNFVLRMSPESLEEINKIKDWYDDQCAIGKKYSSDMMMGIVGKADKQIHKLAAILHVCSEWAEGGTKSEIIPPIRVHQAFLIFKECVKVYEVIADNRGVEGQKTHIEAVVKVLRKMANDRDPKLKIKLSSFRDKIKNNKQLKRENFTDFLRAELLPQMEAMNYLVFDELNEIIYINPLLKE